MDKAEEPKQKTTIAFVTKLMRAIRNTDLDDPIQFAAFRQVAEERIDSFLASYKSDLVKRIEERIQALESEMQNFDTQAERAKIRAWRRMIIENEKILSIITTKEYEN